MALIEGKKLQQAVAVAGPIGIKYERNRRTVFIPREVLSTVQMILEGEKVKIDIKGDDQGGVIVEEAIQTGQRKTPVSHVELAIGKKQPRIAYRALPDDWYIS